MEGENKGGGEGEKLVCDRGGKGGWEVETSVIGNRGREGGASMTGGGREREESIMIPIISPNNCHRVAASDRL